jgi:hypothetical protein
MEFIMKRILLAVILLVTLSVGFSAAQEQNIPVRITLKPVVDIPLTPDSNLFQPAGGATISGSYVFPGLQWLSTGISVGYHLGHMQRADLGNLGYLSLISAEPTAETRATIAGLIDLYLSGSVGFFYGSMTDNPSSSVSNFVLSGGIGINIRATQALTIGIYSEYRRYESLYHLIGIGLGVDLFLGGVK